MVSIRSPFLSSRSEPGDLEVVALHYCSLACSLRIIGLHFVWFDHSICLRSRLQPWDLVCTLVISFAAMDPGIDDDSSSIDDAPQLDGLIGPRLEVPVAFALRSCVTVTSTSSTREGQEPSK